MSRNGFQYAKYFGEYDEYRNTGEPCSRRVSNDATFYPLPTASSLGTYLSQIPVDVEICLRCRKSSPVRSMRSMSLWGKAGLLFRRSEDGDCLRCRTWRVCRSKKAVYIHES